MQTFALWLYRLITWALAPLLRMRLKRRARKEPMYGKFVQERFGYYTQPSSQGWVWIHAVSLGETRAAAILLRELRLQLPDIKLLLTHGTATGREEGAKLLQAGDLQVWQPWDSAAATRKFIAHFKPRIGILMETEVWPNLCAASLQAGLPLVLTNARLSEPSLKRALNLRPLSAPAYASLTHVFAQTQLDAQRLAQAGAQSVHVTGNLKFDVQADPHLQRLGHAYKQATPARAVLALASSREGEEALFLKQIRALAGIEYAQYAINSIANKNTQWLIIPRHPQRFDEVQRLCEQSGFSVSRRSQWGEAPEPADVWLGDTLGEMAMYFSLADIALLGGSFEPLGGQNLIEAIAADCPVVMGPHTFNFLEACDSAVQTGAALRAADMHAALDLGLQVASNNAQLQHLQQQGRTWLASSQGAAARQAQAIARLIKSPV